MMLQWISSSAHPSDSSLTAIVTAHRRDRCESSEHNEGVTHQPQAHADSRRVGLPRRGDQGHGHHGRRDQRESDECDEDQCCGGALNFSIAGIYDRGINT